MAEDRPFIPHGKVATDATVEDLERFLERLQWDYEQMCRLVIEKVPPEPLAKLLVEYVDDDRKNIVEEIVEYAKQQPSVSSAPFERRVLCPLCGDSASSTYEDVVGFKLPLGLEMHLRGAASAHQCEVMKAAHHLWKLQHGERVRQERLAAREEYRRARRSKLYQTGPACEGQELSPGFDRDATEMEVAEARLASNGFEARTDGPLRAYTKTWRQLMIYADPRKKTSMAFHAFDGHKLLGTITIRDAAKDLSKALDAKLRSLR